MNLGDWCVKVVDRLLTNHRRLVELLFWFKTVDRDNRYVQYVNKHLCYFLYKPDIEVPRIVIVPQWYIRLLYCVIGPNAPVGRVEGLCVFDVVTLDKTIYISDEIDIETVWGSSIVLHELVHVDQYCEGRSTQPTNELEFEARLYQKLYLVSHGEKVDNSFLIG